MLIQNKENQNFFVHTIKLLKKINQRMCLWYSRLDDNDRKIYRSVSVLCECIETTGKIFVIPNKVFFKMTCGISWKSYVINIIKYGQSE